MDDIKFHLSFMIMMLACGRTEEAQQALVKLEAAIQMVEDTHFNKGENA